MGPQAHPHFNSPALHLSTWDGRGWLLQLKFVKGSAIVETVNMSAFISVGVVD